MIDPNELREGWYIARQLTDNNKIGWCFVYVKGEVPFLAVWPAITGIASDQWWVHDRHFTDIEKHAVWQFAQRIEMPQEAT